ncbi:centrosomal protein of 131 kDa-like [Branchiostoma lanceolatum]|uniref:C1orf189 protein n=1 Tax=Branchiostoma lanceolatum TaxID=7740 RepID=A0A8J9ZLY1_BRALA|nr:C1orf189 [Branchiostoma lanceolatum]
MSLMASMAKYEGLESNKAQQRITQRIKKDEMYASRQNTVRHEKETNLVSEWSEGLEEASEKKRYKADLSKMKEEVRLANRAMVAVRRAALKKQIEEEHRAHEQELHAMGKAFYIKRT